MGLDVGFYKDLVFITEEKGDMDAHYENDEIWVWTYDEFKDHYYPLKQGWYKADYIGGFKAGSYTGYGMFREQLCLKLFGFKPIIIWKNPIHFKELPFYYLINFADNEGVITGDAFKKLQKDFRENDLIFDNEWIQEKYDIWKEYILKSECVVFE